MNIFNHETSKKKYVFFVEKDGIKLSIVFGNELDPYSGSRSPSGEVYPDVITNRYIGLSKVKTPKMYESIGEFLKWAEDAKKEVKDFLLKNELEIEDIKIMSIIYQEPIESISDVKISDLISI